MPVDTRRRSSRIPKQLAIFLIGSDIEGKIFSEETRTVVLSRHGAGILSQYKLSAEQEIIVRCVDSGKEVEVRVVGQIGTSGNRHIYGVAFLDPEVNFWALDFGERTEAEQQASRAFLECSGCKERETVQHSDMESDVFAINQSVVRYCKNCGSSTLWRAAPEDLAPSPAEVAAPSATKSDAGAAAPRSVPVATQPTAARPEERRKHSRTRVKFQALIRRPGMPDDLVSCEDMSRGGLRFKSKKQYFVNTAIEVAVPYSPGSQSIFVPGEIAYVHESPGENIFHCGVTYTKSSR
jgi:hypothetical protein